MKLGYILMLDNSPSMDSAREQVKVNAKAFVGCSRENDQFGVCSFSDSAAWLYPQGTDPGIITVSEDVPEIRDAHAQIENMPDYQGGWTNIGDAIRIGNTMIAKANTDLKAFVLLSDGEHNTGTHPRDVLGNQPPIYVAGLGYRLKEEYFNDLTKKNLDSHFYHEPDFFKMMTMFNDITGAANKSPVLLNSLDSMMKGANYNLKKFKVSREGDLSLNLAWNSKKYQYITGYLQKNTFKLSLKDPDNRDTPYQPDIVGDGFCIYRLKNLRPGEWKLATEYSIDNQEYCTFGCINYVPELKLQVNTPTRAKVGENIRLSVQMFDGSTELTDVSVRAHIEKPAISVENALKKYERELDQITLPEINDGSSEEISKLKVLREKMLPQGDIMARATASAFMPLSNDGIYETSLDNISTPGAYTVRVHVEGTDPQTGYPFSEVKRHTVVVTT